LVDSNGDILRVFFETYRIGGLMSAAVVFLMLMGQSLGFGRRKADIASLVTPPAASHAWAGIWGKALMVSDI